MVSKSVPHTLLPQTLCHTHAVASETMPLTRRTAARCHRHGAVCPNRLVGAAALSHFHRLAASTTTKAFTSTCTTSASTMTRPLRAFPLGSRRRPIDLTGADSEDGDGPVISCDDLFPPPVQVTEDGTKIYRVERVIGLRRTGGGVLYLVKWFGYPASAATLVHERDMDDCQDAVRAFRNGRNE